MPSVSSEQCSVQSVRDLQVECVNVDDLELICTESVEELVYR